MAIKVTRWVVLIAIIVLIVSVACTIILSSTKWFPDSISVFTAVLSLVSIIQLYLLKIAADTAEATKKSADAAKQSAEVAKCTLIASQRGWIRIDEIGLGGGGLAIDKNGASVSIFFKITNTGNSPAINVTPYAWLVCVKNGGPFPLQVQEKKCREIRAQPFAMGFTLFPSESFPSNIRIDKWSLATNVSRQNLEEGAALSADKKHVLLYIVGCIDYTFPTDPNEHHQTSFIYEIRQNDMYPTIFEDGIISIDQLSLVETGIGLGKYAD